jgi:hypothetical protein
LKKLSKHQYRQRPGQAATVETISIRQHDMHFGAAALFGGAAHLSKHLVSYLLV